MQRWLIALILLTLTIKVIHIGVMSPAVHAMDMAPCPVVMCEPSADQCLKHCLAAEKLGTSTPAAAPTQFLIMSGALVMVISLLVIRRTTFRITTLAPPGLAFVRTTVLRE